MFEPTFRNIDDVLWKEAGCATELDYTEQTTWMLFLKYLDDLEHERAQEAELLGKPYSFVIDEPLLPTAPGGEQGCGPKRTPCAASTPARVRCCPAPGSHGHRSRSRSAGRRRGRCSGRRA